MFRTVVLSIVLLLGIGPDISMLCRAVCDPAAAAANGCHHQADPVAASASLTGGHDCDASALIGTAYVREDSRRTAPSPPTALALRVARNQLATPGNAVLLHLGPGHLSSLEKRPLETALRI